MSDDYETGVYCKHWLELGGCVECAKDLCDFAALAAENEGLRDILRLIVEMPSPHSSCWLPGCNCVACQFARMQDVARQSLSRKAAP